MAKIDVTGSMIDAAMDIGVKSGLFAPHPKREDVAKMIEGVLALASGRATEKFNCRVKNAIGKRELRARIIGPEPGRQGYLEVETEEGKRLHVHANEVYYYSPYKPQGA
ncbi:hypothetical protein [Paraburkholderia sacchari]|uniref:hypothetical protein n=1 Tax=Paraburkholderia sacchari TaxID=159450 RepID=UPI0005421B36|nr:hypothetical protein [Paraburkholderia sacchari]NLP64206.1 hypothetical protein [Paraburkholderia sacchari]